MSNSVEAVKAEVVETKQNNSLAEVIKAEVVETGLQETKAKQIQDLYLPMIETLNELEDEFNGIVSQPVTLSLTKAAKDLRLRIKKIRTSANNARKAAKEEYIIAGRAIQGAYNTVEFAVKSKETKLEEIEKHFELMEKKRLEDLQDSRAKQLDKFKVNPIPDGLAYMSDDVFASFLSGAETTFKKKQAEAEAAKKEEEERKKLEILREERNAELMPIIAFAELPVDDQGNDIKIEKMAVKDFKKLISDAKKKQKEHFEEQDRIRKENERLKSEASERKAKEAKEKEKREEDARKKKEAEASLRKRRLAILDGYEWNGEAAIDPDTKDVIISDLDLISIKSAEYVAIQKAWNAKVKDRNEKKAEEARIIEEKKAEEARVKAEHERKMKAKLEAEAKEKKRLEKELAERKAKVAKEEKERKERERKARTAPDKEKIEKLISDLENFELPEVTSAEAKVITAGTKQLIGKITTWIESKAKNL